MIPLLVFSLHIIAAAALFTKRWQDEGAIEGFLALFFLAVIFFVGWSMMSFLTKLFMSPPVQGQLFDRDAVSLLLLTAVEAVGYLLFRGRKGEA